MGKIYYVMGKSASGKDTLYKKLLELIPELRTVLIYTTRPVREGEKEGVDYHFTDQACLEEKKKQGKIIELRTYETMAGPWSYATVDDGQIDLQSFDYVMIGTLESYRNVKAYYEDRAVLPVYLWLEDKARLLRAIEREEVQPCPNYGEVCRRFLADEADFSEEKLREAGITEADMYENRDSEETARKVAGRIRGMFPYFPGHS